MRPAALFFATRLDEFLSGPAGRTRVLGLGQYRRSVPRSPTCTARKGGFALPSRNVSHPAAGPGTASGDGGTVGGDTAAYLHANIYCAVVVLFIRRPPYRFYPFCRAAFDRHPCQFFARSLWHSVRPPISFPIPHTAISTLLYPMIYPFVGSGIRSGDKYASIKGCEIVPGWINGSPVEIWTI